MIKSICKNCIMVEEDRTSCLNKCEKLSLLQSIQSEFYNLKTNPDYDLQEGLSVCVPNYNFS